MATVDEILRGSSTANCLADCFTSSAGKRDGLVCYEGSTFTLFWYQTGEKQLVIPSSGGIPFPPRSILSKLAAFSEELCHGSPVLLQVYVPIEAENGQTMLTISQQPFSIGGPYSRTADIRNHYVERECHSYSEIGPPGRVFEQGFPEYCPDIECYTTDEFPTRDYLKRCGVVSYCALPLFESHRCVGVLECFTMESQRKDGNFAVFPVILALGALMIACPNAPLHKCDKNRKDLLYPRLYIEYVLLYSVRTDLKVPFIQLWVRCMCADSDTPFTSAGETNKLFCEIRSCSEGLECFSHFENELGTYRTCFVKNRQSLVGEAYSVNRPCFCRDTSQFTLPDYPFVHLTRSSGLAACFVIPLEFVHPSLDTLFIEIFLPPEYESSNVNPKAVLESLLPKLAQGFSKVNFDVRLKQDEEFLVEVIHSDSEKFEYFNVYRRSNVTDCLPTLDGSSKEVITTMVEDPATLDVPEQLAAVAAEDQNTRSTRLNPYPSAQDTTNSNREDEMNMDMDVLEASPNAQGTTHSSGEVAAAIAEDPATMEDLGQQPGAGNTPDSFENAATEVAVEPITLEALERWYGNPQEVVAKHFNVSVSTLKRKAEIAGCKKPWPWHEKRRVGKSDSNNAGTSANYRRIRQSYKMFGKATYKDDTVKFPLGTGSGFAALGRKLAERFKVRVEEFKIKYKHEDEWILIACDEDLRIGLKTIKSTGGTTMDLSIFPLLTS